MNAKQPRFKRWFGQVETEIVGATDVAIIKKGEPAVPLRPKGDLILSNAKIFEADDFTYYFRILEVENALNSAGLGDAKILGAWHTIECNVKLSMSSASLAVATLQGRASLAKCFDAQWCAVTVRKNASEGRLESFSTPESQNRAVNCRCGKKNSWDPQNNPRSASHLVGLKDLCPLLRKLLPLDEPRPSGLIVVSGSTNSCKSNVARGLITEMLNGRKVEKRRLHVLTLEDPVEKWLCGSETPELYANRWLDYTVRELGEQKDCPNIATGLVDARRQTPFVVYIGEVREDTDWRHILDFAGSGHLVVATTHAGSLVETLRNIMSATAVSTPSALGMMAERVLALIHIRGITPSSAPSSDALLPSLWRRTPSSVAKLVADGLSSLLPENPRENVIDPQVGSIGRYWFSGKVLLPMYADIAAWNSYVDSPGDYNSGFVKGKDGFNTYSSNIDSIRLQALGLDLRGL